MTFTGTGYSVGTVYTQDNNYFMALATPPQGPDASQKIGKPYLILGTNFIFVSMKDISLGFRFTKNGDSMPVIDVYNSLFCSADSVVLHQNLGTFMIGMERGTPFKGQLFDYSVTGTGPASVVMTMVYTPLSWTQVIY